MLPPFQINGPSDNPYPGTFCLPQVPVPGNLGVKVGDEGTIQVVEVARHGGAMYNVCKWNCPLSSPLHFTLTLSNTNQQINQQITYKIPPTN